MTCEYQKNNFSRTMIVIAKLPEWAEQCCYRVSSRAHLNKAKEQFG